LWQAIRGAHGEFDRGVVLLIGDLLGGRRDRFSLEFCRGEEKRREWYRMTATTFRFSGRTYVVLATRDITKAKRIEGVHRNLEARMRHQQKLQSIGTLAGGVAHEINNPINGIMNYAELIRERVSEPDRVQEFASEIISESERVAAIVRNLLAFARQEKQARVPTRMADILAATLQLIQTIMRHDRIELQIDVPDDLPMSRCDGQQIQQVFMNLLTNARDALNERFPTHDPEKRILVSAREIERDGKRYVRTTVEDHGPGMPAELRERIFDPFFTTKQRQVGTGLGLSISHGIVSDHGGDLSVESKENAYTRFHVDLPLDEDVAGET
jgi:signal transduction histidine kinase